MKIKTTLTATLTALTFVIVGCEEKKTASDDPHAGHNHGKPVPHDHDGDGKPDHPPGEHHHSHGGHDHPPKVAGPNGGRIMTSPDFKNELYVTDDRMVRITFLDEDNKPVAVGTQEVSMIGGDRSDPTSLTFSKAPDGMSLISSGKLPEGDSFPVIITVKTSADASPARARLSLDLNQCDACKHKKYACICCDHTH